MRRGFAPVGLVLVMLFHARSVDADVTEFVGRTVSAIALQSQQRPLDDARLLDLVQTHVGQPLVMSDVRESIVHLLSLGRFEDVRVSASRRGESVAVTYELVPVPVIASLSFKGADVPGIDEGRLRQLAVERFGRSPRQSRADALAQFIEEEIRKAGYLHARVSADVRAVGTDRSSLVLDVAAGDRTRIGSIAVQGDAGMSEAELLNRLGLVSGRPYQRDVLAGRVESYLTERRGRGFYDARLSVAFAFADGDRLVNLLITAAQGPRMRVVVRGDVAPSERLDALVPAGREGVVDEDLLEDSSLRIEEHLRAEGYRDAVAPFSREAADSEQLLVFTVRKGPQFRVARVDLSGNLAVPVTAIQPRLRVRAGQPFSEAALDADRAAIEDVYRRAGFARVEVAQDVRPLVDTASSGVVPMSVAFTISENVRTTVGSVRVETSEPGTVGDLPDRLGLRAGQPFFLGQMAADRDAIERHYANIGFQAAFVTALPGLSADGARADVVFTVRAGVRLYVDHVLIVGNVRTRTSTIERELQFKPGDPIGLDAMNESQRRLAVLGLFRRARLTLVGHGDEARRDIVVTVDEVPLTTVGYGGGFEVRPLVAPSVEDPAVASETLEFAPRASFEIGRRNLLGRNRSVNLFTSASLHPGAGQNTGSGSNVVDGGRPRFPEYRILGQFLQPGLFGTGTDFRVTGAFEQQRRSSFDFGRRSASAEVAQRVSPRVSVSAGYQIQRARVFNQTSEQRGIDRIFPSVRLSTVSASVIRDTRSDPLDPVGGRYVSANLQVAARAIGSRIGFAKSYLSAQAFHAVRLARPIVLAGSARLGVASLFTSEFVDDDNRDLPASERFYAGGDTTVRGFALDQLGVRHFPAQPGDTLDAGSFPLGGSGLVILNAEIRVPVRAGLGAVGFVDAGNVFKASGDIDFGLLRWSAGFGVRYRSPIGPIRVDLGFKLHQQQTGPDSREARTALHVSFGQAF